MDSSYFANGKVYAWEETFAVVKVKQPIPNAFAVIHDKNEITCVIRQTERDSVPYLGTESPSQENILESSGDWNIITFDMLLSLNMVGFIAHVTSALAKEGVDVLTFSAYSTEHVLVQSKDLAKALGVLEHLGCKISSNP